MIKKSPDLRTIMSKVPVPPKDCHIKSPEGLHVKYIAPKNCHVKSPAGVHLIYKARKERLFKQWFMLNEKMDFASAKIKTKIT